MSKAVNEKWKKTFPDTIGNQNRPAEGVDDTQPFETGCFPQVMANDPVRYDLQNAAMSQSMSNDARLKEMVDARGKELDDHKVDPGAHKAGIAGNAATATKVVTTAASGASANIAEASMANNDVARIRVSGADNAGELALETADDGTEPIVARQYTGVFKDVARTAAILDTNGNTSFPGTVVAPKFTGALNGNAATASKLASPRTISLTGKAAGSTSFDGSANASINVTSVNADTASKLSTARKINITGNASGSAAFDGSGDISINTTVNESKHAAAADTLKSSAATETSTVARSVWLSWEGDNTKQTVSPNLTYTCATKTLTTANFKGHLAGNADTADSATTANSLDRALDRPASANVTYNDGKIRYFLATSKMSEGKPSDDGPVMHLSWDKPGWETQIAVNNPSGHIQTRAQNTGTWGSWTTILDSENFNNYAPTKTGGGASGSWNINAATATKLQTPRTISLTGNASGSASFDGSGNISINTTVNNSAAANKVNNSGNKTAIKDGTHEPNGLYLYQCYNNGYPTSYGNVISIGGEGGGELLAGWSGTDKGIEHLYYRSRRDASMLWSDWRTVAFTSDINNYAPTKTGNGASGTWDISISGNAATATTANALNGIINREPATNNHAIIPGAYERDYCEFHEFGAVWNFIKTSNQGSTTVASIRSDGFHGNVVGNADTATNADTVDGYHASDLLRTLGGNRTPVITDIFDRAGTIDMTTMSASDKATHKANINKAENVTQNLWNNSTGIHAYGGDLDMNGYSRGALKLTQSYKNFDKILVVVTNDDANWTSYCMWDVWELAHAFANSYRFNLSTDADIQWNVYGTAKHGTTTNYAVSTDTIWNTQGQNCGIIAIYGIKY